jgi:hypothetical protein
MVCAVDGIAFTPFPRARLLEEAPRAIPSGEIKSVAGEFVARVDAPKTVPIVPIVSPPLVEEVLPVTVLLSEEDPPFTVPDIISPPPLLDVTVELPVPPPFVFCVFVILSEDNGPVTSEA